MENTAAIEAWERAAAEADLSVNLPGGVPLYFRWIPAGAFRMGQRGKFPDEEPVHRVTISDDFYLGTFPVTQAQYRAMGSGCLGELKKIEGNLGADPSHFKGDRRPVEQVSWDDARSVCRWLTDSGRLPAGWKAELPSETQWEYACRAGTETDYWNGNGEAALAEVGWFGGNAGGETHPVGEKNLPNSFGLHDLHGNVAEWCLDYFDPRRYRKRVEGDAGTALLDLAAVEFEGANPTFLAWAGITGHVADGDRSIATSKKPALNQLLETAEGIVENGDTSWQGVIDAVKPALKRGEWPEPLVDMARQLHGIFQGWVDAASGSGDPNRVLRGGAWYDTAGFCRSAFRVRGRPGSRNWTDGFRLALVPGPVKKKQGPKAKGAQRETEAQASRDDAARAEPARGAA